MENTVEFYRVSDLEKYAPIYIEKNERLDSYVKPNEVLVSFDGTVGRVGIGYNGVFSTGIKKAVPINDNVSNGLLYFLFRSEYVKKTIEKYASGTVLKHASSSIQYINVPYDSIAFRNFSEIIEPLYNEIIACIIENKKLKNYYKFILPLIVNGQIKIED